MTRGLAAARGYAVSRAQRVAGGTGGGTPSPPDPAPSIVSGPTLVSRTQTSITLTWTSDQYVQSWVEYGTTASYGSESTHETSFSYKTHVQAISGLTAGTTYHFAVHVVNAGSQETVGDDATFATLAGSGYPATTSLSYIAVPSLSLPAYLTPTDEPTFGTKIMRISDIAGVANFYSKWQAWNSDGTRLWLVRRGSYPGVMLDASDYSVITTSQGYYGNSMWSNTQPDRAYGCLDGSNQLRATTMSTGASVAVKTFSGYYDVSLGDGEGGFSLDDRYFALMAQVTSGGTQRVLVWDQTLDATTTIAVSARPNNCMMTPDGLGVIVGFSSTGSGMAQGTHHYLRDGTWQRQLTTLVNHGDVGMSTAGDPVWVCIESGRVRMYRLSDGTMTNLTGVATSGVYGHVSCRNYDRDGYAYVSPYVKAAGQSGDDWVFSVKLDGSGDVEGFAHAHNASTDGNPYVGQPQATVSRDGRKVLWGSKWDGGASVWAMVAGVAL